MGKIITQLHLDKTSDTKNSFEKTHTFAIFASFNTVFSSEKIAAAVCRASKTTVNCFPSCALHETLLLCLFIYPNLVVVRFIFCPYCAGAKPPSRFGVAANGYAGATI
ncbi:hypothetical protein B6N25_07905 [Sphingobacteriales bacterium TSM_CSS]|nr:hypothetical protein B6N25_07905 [Sphingobacteriales bacterium TSM_CSS]